MCLKNDREGLVRKLSARFHLLRILSPFTVSTTSRTETLNSNSKKIKMNSFIPIPHPFPSLFFAFLCFLKATRWSDSPILNSCTFPMLLRSLFRNLSLFPSCYLYRSIPLLRPLVCSRSTLPIHLLRSISSVSDPLHFPLCLWIFFPIPLLLFLLFSYFPIPIFPKSIRSSLFSFIASSIRLLVFFIPFPLSPLGLSGTFCGRLVFLFFLMWCSGAPGYFPRSMARRRFLPSKKFSPFGGIRTH
jgi:hypothetical protein